MRYNPHKHHRRSIRLKGYDYAQPGWYFITICTQNRVMIFGDVVDGKMTLNPAGRVVEKLWQEITIHYPDVYLDQFIVMPNHIHGIIHIIDNQKCVGVQNFEPLRQSQKTNQFQKIIPRSIGAIIRGFKTGVTKWYRKNTEIHIVWQRNYYEQIIRDENDLYRIRQYIIKNSKKWRDDIYF